MITSLHYLATPSSQNKQLEMSDTVGANNFVITNTTGAAVIFLTGLSTSTNYSVQCLTMRPHNIAMHMSVSRAHIAYVMTQCCAHVTVTIIKSSTFLGSQQVSLRVNINEQPRDILNVKLLGTSGCLVYPTTDLFLSPSSSHSFSQLYSVIGNNFSCSSAFCSYACQIYATLEGFVFITS